MSQLTLDTDQYAHLQDVMSTLPMARSYIPFCLAFATSAPDAAITTALRQALDRLADAIPHLAGQVVIEDHIPKIGMPRNSNSNSNNSIELVVKDLRNEMPTLAQLVQARFPFSMLDGSLLTPKIALSWTPGTTDPSPVISFQANFIQGGLLLSIFANHTQMDCAGMGTVASLLAQALRNEHLLPNTTTAVAIANQPRTDIPPLLPDIDPADPLLDDVITKPTSFTTAAGFARIQMSPPPRWIYLYFSTPAQARLKTAAKPPLQDDSVPYITTDDALCALLWQRIAHARQAASSTTTTTTKLGRVVNVRKHFGLDDSYLGNMGDTIEYTHNSPPPIWDQPLGAVASRLRKGLQDTARITRHMQGLATLLGRHYQGADREKVVFGANMDFNADVYVSSYTKVFACCHEWGAFGEALGVPLVGRRPDLKGSALPGLLMFMPKDRDGGLAVAVALKGDDIERLRADEVLKAYAEFLE